LLLFSWVLHKIGGVFSVSAVVGLRSLTLLTSFAVTPLAREERRAPPAIKASKFKYMDLHLVYSKLWAMVESVAHHEIALLAAVLVVSRAMEGTSREESVEYRPPMPYLSHSKLSPPHRIAKACVSLCWYLGKTILPTGITHQYLLRQPFRLTEAPIIMGVVLVVAFSLCIAYMALAKPNRNGSRGRRVTDCVFVAWFSFIFLVLPALGLVSHGPAYWAGDRYRSVFFLLMGSFMSKP